MSQTEQKKVQEQKGKTSFWRRMGFSKEKTAKEQASALTTQPAPECSGPTLLQSMKQGTAAAQEKTVEGYEAAKEQVKAAAQDTSSSSQPSTMDKMKQGGAAAQEKTVEGLPPRTRLPPVNLPRWTR
ncbi:unnamed protein product [Effrenium voratum]|nr:unnamed protein product [Effrenium voratum]